MTKLTNRTTAVVTLFLLALLAWVSFAQDKRIANEDWYGDVKKTLAKHYTGKTVKLRRAIPATRHGLEMTDGAVGGSEQNDSIQTVAQPGDELTIKNFKVRSTSIELLLNKNGEQPKRRFFSRPKRPRINLRFSRELNGRDLTVENINRWLAAAVDLGTPAPVIAEHPSNNTQASIASTPEPTPATATATDATSPPMATVIADLSPVNQNIGELTIECPTGQARVYIDNAYSGFAPRTVRLRAGVHSILVMAAGYAPWEQRLIVPGGKSSIAKADLRR